MPDQIGRITVPDVAASGTFPLPFGWPVQMTRDFRVITHEIGNQSANLKISQRFLDGTGAPVYRWKKQITLAELQTLRTFFDDRKGGYQPFTAAIPQEDGTAQNTIVRFRNEPLRWQMVSSALADAECGLVEHVTAGPTYPLTSSVTRFPAGTLATKLTEQAQEVFPLVRIRVREAAVPDIYLSNRRCTVGSQLYLPRILDWADAASSIEGAAEYWSLTLGNADRVMRDCATDTDLSLASIEFSLYHVGAQTKLDVWKGVIRGFGGGDNDQFSIECIDDPDLDELYPPGDIDRRCRKKFNDGVACPAAAAGGTNLGVPCDKGLDTPQGCRYHNMIRYHGGQQAKPQGVQVRDNSTGRWGIGRLMMSSFGLVNETVQGRPLKEIYTDTPMKVPCDVIEARDESDYLDGLGIIGAGPIASISNNALDHKLNGQAPHGPGILGLRISSGPDPALQAGGIFPADSDHWLMLTETSGPPTAGTEIFAAGVAFAEIRIRDAKGLQLRQVTEHQMEVTVTGGLGGWVWSAPGSRAWQGPNVSPPWIAANMILRSKGIVNASAAAQEAVVDVPSAISLGAICSTVVTKLLPTGSSETETQFRFRGMLADKKPLREYLRDVLASCNGYFIRRFGKVAFGARLNASSVESFTEGNIISGSLKWSSRQWRFNELTVELVDEEFDYQRNTLSLPDDTHIGIFGRRRSTISLLGCAGKSQAGRIAQIKLAEELGGVTESEYRIARTGTVAVPLLGLAVEPGMVIQLDVPDMPTGGKNVRVTSMRLRRDYSVEYDWETVQASMYNAAVGPKPADVDAAPVPAERIEEVIPVQPWFPHREQPAVGDPTYAREDWSFECQQLYSEAKDSTGIAQIVVRGDHPETSTVGTAPRIRTYSLASGGSLQAGNYVAVCVVATDPDGKPSPPSTPVAVTVTGSSRKIVMTNIDWPDDVPAGGYRIFAAIDRAIMTEQSSGSGRPATLEVPNLTSVRTRGLPQQRLAGLMVRGRETRHAGIIGSAVEAVTSTTIKIGVEGWTANQLAGRTLTILADASDGSAPFWNFAISANTTDGICTVTPNPAAAGVEAGDVATIDLKATTATVSTIGDALLDNPQYPGGLAPPDAEAGDTIRIWGGTGAGQEKLIASHNATIYTIHGEFNPIPDATSKWSVERTGWTYTSDLVAIPAEQLGMFEAALSVDNLDGKTLRVEVVARDRDGRESEKNPWRFIYVFGTDAGIGGASEVAYL